MKTMKILLMVTSLLSSTSFAGPQTYGTLGPKLDEFRDAIICPKDFRVEFEVYETQQTMIFSQDKNGNFIHQKGLKACEYGWKSYESYCVLANCVKTIPPKRETR